MHEKRREALATVCKALYKRSRPFSSQHAFAQELFYALLGAQLAYSPETWKKVYRGERWPNEDFPNPIDGPRVHDLVHRCFTSRMSKERQPTNTVLEIAGALNLKGGDPVQSTLEDAIVVYLNEITNNPDKLEAFSHYYGLCDSQPDMTLTQVLRPLQRGDHATNFSANQYTNKVFGLYEAFEHEWLLMNDGAAAWSGRSLVCTNPADPTIRPAVDRVLVPNCEPSRARRHTIPVGLQIQHSEGQLTSHWIMVDSDGNDCFPDEPGKFDIVVRATFKPHHTGEDHRD